MNVLRVTLTLSLLISTYSTSSCLKNERSEPFSNAQSIRHNRRIGLNEYLVPPPAPKPHPVRSGRVANHQPPEAPGYFSQFMNWLNPFSYGASTSTPQKPPSLLEPSYPPPPQTYGPVPFNAHSALQPSLHPPLGSQTSLPLHPPLSPSTPPQHHGILLTAPPGAHHGPPLSLPPGAHHGPPLSLPPGAHHGPPLSLPPGAHSGPPLSLPPDAHHGPPLSLPPGAHSGPPLSLPPGAHHGPPLSLPLGAHSGPPLSLPPGAHSGPPLSLPPGAHSAPPLNLPGPPLQLYNVPSPAFHDIQPLLPNPKDSRGLYLPPNKGKQCNPCNKVPWIPMQGAGFHTDKYSHPQSPNAYLPPSNQANHDVQYAASHEIRIPDLSQAPIDQNPFNDLLPNPLLYPGPMPPLYKAEPFNPPSQSPPGIDNVGHFEPPPLPVTPLAGQEHRGPEINDPGYNIRGIDDPRSIGTAVSEGHASVIPQKHETGANKGFTDLKESFGSSIPDTQSPLSVSYQDQAYHNSPTILSQGSSGVINQPVEQGQSTVSSFGLSNADSQEFSGQSGNEYRDPYGSNPASNTELNYLPPDLNPSASYGTSTFHNRDTESSNYQYSDDLSPSGSVVKDHATAQTPSVSAFAPTEEHIHFEESPLLDLTKKGESRTDAQWSTSTIGYDAAETLHDTLKTTTDYALETDNLYFQDSSNFVRSTESYSSADIQDINSVFGPSTSTSGNFPTGSSRNVETSTIGTRYTDQQDVSYIPPSGQPAYLWPSLVMHTSNLRNESTKSQVSSNHLAEWNNSSPEIRISGKQDSAGSKDAKDTPQRQQGIKRNKQVQVIIPYTSEYTPIPFQQSYGDWSIRTNFERTQPRKVPLRNELNVDNYLQQESRNDIRVVNQFQSQFNFNNSDRLNVQSIRPSSTAAEDLRSATTKVNTSIDVRRLQKNIDNWTIQEYSKPTTSSTILPSSLHPYLSPSKKIPTEYLTTTEPGDHENESKDHIESVKTYSLAGFSFNEVEHEGSASNRIESTQPAAKVVRIESPKAMASSGVHTVNKSKMEEKSTWEAHSVSISPVNKERVYVVTPQPVPELTTKNDSEKRKSERRREHSHRTSESIVNDANDKGNISEFEAIEKAYQVLPQAVNNLAVASTGKENIPLWGIMEHEEFASLNLDENDDETTDDVVDGPVLYSGHSKVSRAKR